MVNYKGFYTEKNYIYIYIWHLCNYIVRHLKNHFKNPEPHYTFLLIYFGDI